MRHSFTTASIAALALIGCNQQSAATAQTATPSGEVGERRFDITGFDRVVLRGSDDVDVRVGPAFSVTARGDTGMMEALDVQRDGSALRIGRKKSSNSFRWRSDAKPIRLSVTLPALRGVSLAGSGDMRVEGATGDAFDAALAGSGDMFIAGLAVTSADLSIAGSGDMKAAGRADRVKLSIAGSGDADGSSLAAKGAEVSIAGSGNARLAVNGDAAVSIRGSGDVDLGSAARCTSSVRGSGTITCG